MAGILQLLKTLILNMPAVTELFKLFDKWFSKTTEEKIKDAHETSKKDSINIGEAIKKAENGDTSDVERIIGS